LRHFDVPTHNAFACVSKRCNHFAVTSPTRPDRVPFPAGAMLGGYPMSMIGEDENNMLWWDYDPAADVFAARTSNFEIRVWLRRELDGSRKTTVIDFRDGLEASDFEVLDCGRVLSVVDENENVRFFCTRAGRILQSFDNSLLVRLGLRLKLTTSTDGVFCAVRQRIVRVRDRDRDSSATIPLNDADCNGARTFRDGRAVVTFKMPANNTFALALWDVGFEAATVQWTFTLDDWNMGSSYASVYACDAPGGNVTVHLVAAPSFEIGRVVSWTIGPDRTVSAPAVVLLPGAFHSLVDNTVACEQDEFFHLLDLATSKTKRRRMDPRYSVRLNLAQRMFMVADACERVVHLYAI